MRFFGTGIRVVGCMLGLFLFGTGLLDILGYMPHSNEMPWTERLTASLPAMIAGAVLLLPMRGFIRGPRYAALQAIYLVLVFAVLMKLTDGALDYLQGQLHPAVIPTALVLVSIVAANAGVLWLMHRRAARPSDDPEGEANKSTRAAG